MYCIFIVPINLWFFNLFSGTMFVDNISITSLKIICARIKSFQHLLSE